MIYPLPNSHKAIFNQTCHKSFVGEGMQTFSNEGTYPFPREDN